MNTPLQPEDLHGRLGADIEARVRLLFARWPALCGFAVESRGVLTEYADAYPIPEADLCVTHIGVYPLIHWQIDDIHDEVVCELANLVHERPHAQDYLLGRTFARTLQ